MAPSCQNQSSIFGNDHQQLFPRPSAYSQPEPPWTGTNHGFREPIWNGRSGLGAFQLLSAQPSYAADFGYDNLENSSRLPAQSHNTKLAMFSNGSDNRQDIRQTHQLTSKTSTYAARNEGSCCGLAIVSSGVLSRQPAQSRNTSASQIHHESDMLEKVIEEEPATLAIPASLSSGWPCHKLKKSVHLPPPLRTDVGTDDEDTTEDDGESDLDSGSLNEDTDDEIPEVKYMDYFGTGFGSTQHASSHKRPDMSTHKRNDEPSSKRAKENEEEHYVTFNPKPNQGKLNKS